MAPKHAGGYSETATLHYWKRDLKALEQLLARIEQADPDVKADSGKEQSDDERRRQAKEALDYTNELLTRARAARHARTLGVAISQHVLTSVGAVYAGMEIDRDAVVRLAEEGVDVSLCEATREALLFALAERASYAVAQASGEYADMAARHPLLGSSYALACGLEQPGQMREAIVANADFQRMVTMMKEAHQLVPSSSSSWNWQMVRFVDADFAEQIASDALADDVGQLMVKIRFRLAGDSPTTLLSQAWHMRMAGNNEAAERLLSEAVEREVSIPAAVLGSP